MPTPSPRPPAPLRVPPALLVAALAPGACHAAAAAAAAAAASVILNVTIRDDLSEFLRGYLRIPTDLSPVSSLNCLRIVSIYLIDT